jgi:hypothetical protein
MTEKKTSWMHMMPIHLPESTSEVFIYQPQRDVGSMWLNVVVNCDGNPLRLEFFTPDDGELDLRITGRKYDQQIRLDEGGAIDLDFATPAQRKAFFRMIVELADWIKEHHSDEV